MWGFWEQLTTQWRWQDLIDVVLVFMVIYKLLQIIRGTRAVQILTGLGVLSLALILSDRFKFTVLNYLLKQFFEYLFLIVVILFQDEIRRALANIGKNPFLSSASEKSKAAQVLDEVCKAANVLAAKRIGALIVLERQHGLKNYAEGATIIDSEVSAELLVSIFNTSSPIHDGAVIISSGRVMAAGCFVPVTLEGDLDRNLGTRHRAAVGLSQETDALVVVLSEERGEISLVEMGELYRDLNLQTLRKKLYTAFDLHGTGSNAVAAKRGAINVESEDSRDSGKDA
jgi:diadenylate cyclase